MSRGEAPFSRAVRSVEYASSSGTNVCPPEEASLAGDGDM
jgi:hypothetical protein